VPWFRRKNGEINLRDTVQVGAKPHILPSNIIVTGAAGFIGSHTVDHLLAAGHTVWGVDNFRTGRRENLDAALSHPRFALHEFDISEQHHFIDFAGTINAVTIVHLAALVSVPESITNPALNDRLNFQATNIVAEAARHHGIARIVFASSAAIYGDPAKIPISEDATKAPISPYGSAKLASEYLLNDYAGKHALTIRCQRYFNVYGPRQDPRSSYSGVISIFLDHLMRKTSPTIFGDGEQTRDFISVHDVARANVIAATQPGLNSGAVNICTGQATSVNELWHLLSLHHSDYPAISYARSRPGEIRHSCGSPAAARETLGFHAEISLPDGLASFAAETLPSSR
jgi:UDP-glucose 4-epimerase